MEIWSHTVVFVVGVHTAFGVVASPSGLNQATSWIDLQSSSIATHDVIHTGVDIGAAKDHLPHLLPVSCGHTNRNGQFLSDLCRYTDLVDAEVGVREITERAQKLTRLPERLLRNRPSFPFRRCVSVLSVRPERCRAGRDAGGLVVKVGGDVVLEQLPQILNDQLRHRSHGFLAIAG